MVIYKTTGDLCAKSVSKKKWSSSKSVLGRFEEKVAFVQVGAWEKAEGQGSSFFVEEDMLSKIVVSDIFFL